jgi:exonuclease SbcC
MRPLKLTMTNFGPYQGTQTIDFRALGENGLYLITGPTGSGKSTIFDAICFALYGKPSKNGRDSKTLRNTYAKDDEITSVALEFSHGSKSYSISRFILADDTANETEADSENKTDENNKKKNVKKKTEKSEDKKSKDPFLKCLETDETIASTKTGITKAVEQILGIQIDQFRTIVMIAQGDFYKLISAKTSERKTILQQIFDTSFINAFQKKIKARAKEIDDNCQSLQNELKVQIQNIKADDFPDFSIYKEQQREFVKNPQKENTLSFLQDVIDKQKDAQENSDQEHKDFQKKITEITKQIEAVKNQQNIKEQIADHEKKKEENETNLPSLQNALAVLQASKPQYDEMDQRIPVLKEKTKEFKKQDELNTQIDKDTKEAAFLAAQNDNTKKQKEDLLNKIQSSEKRLEELVDIYTQQFKVQNALDTLHNQKQKLSGLKTLHKDFSKVQKDLKQAQKAKEHAQEGVSQANYTYNSVWNSYLANTASRLAKDLKEGERCPVCGALHHPDPAKEAHDHDVFSLEQVNEAQDEIKKATDVLSKTITKESSLKTRQDELENQLRKNSLELLKNFDLNTLENQIEKQSDIYNSQEKDLADDLSRISKEIEEKKNLEEKLPFQKEQVQNLEQEHTERETQIALISQKIQSNTKLYQESLEKLQYKTLKEHEEEIFSLQKKVNTFKKDLEEHTKKVLDCEKQIDSYKDHISNMRSLLKDVPDIDLDKKSQQLQDLKEKDDSLLKEQGRRKGYIIENEKLKKTIDELFADFEEVDTKYRWMQELSDTANGTLNGSQKLDFQAFYQAEYFKQILQCANRYFLQMTNGKYELIYRQDAGNNVSLSGLEISVRDYNKKDREASTLSGGESFLASLSLALGLSDCVQQEAGGFILDTMFVDEGFGTLDDETLQTVLSALKELSKNGRLVGLISHVSELKKSISKQIVIESNKSGTSRAKVIV